VRTEDSGFSVCCFELVPENLFFARYGPTFD
jgi:hypothetical protein